VFNAVLITLGSCAAVEIAWRLFTRRNHRGGHARTDEMYSPYTLAARVARERSQDDELLRHTGKHQAVEMLSGELPLLSGYANDSTGRLSVHQYAGSRTRSTSWR
jgi:hypothetical protein